MTLDSLVVCLKFLILPKVDHKRFILEWYMYVSHASSHTSQDANVIEVVQEEGLPGTEVPPPSAPLPAAVIIANPPVKEPGCWDRIKVAIV